MIQFFYIQFYIKRTQNKSKYVIKVNLILQIIFGEPNKENSNLEIMKEGILVRFHKRVTPKPS